MRFGRVGMGVLYVIAGAGHDEVARACDYVQHAHYYTSEAHELLGC